MSRTGRPKKDICKDKRVVLMFTDKEKTELYEFAKLSGLSVSDYLRRGKELIDEETRNKFHLKNSSEDEYYDEYDYYDEYEDDEDNELLW